MGLATSRTTVQSTVNLDSCLPLVRVISLPQDEERRKEFLQRNSAVLRPLMWSFVEAVDGSALQPDDDNSCVVYQKDKKWFSPGAVGCALSHLERWEECRKIGQPLCVLEDDAILHTDFLRAYQQVFRQLSMSNQPWDIVLLSFNFDVDVVVQATPVLRCRSETKAMKAEEFLSQKLAEVTCLGRLLSAFGTCAYVVSPRGADKLIDMVFPLRHIPVPHANGKIKLHATTVDGMMNTVYPVMDAYVCLSPLAITEKGLDTYCSTICAV